MLTGTLLEPLFKIGLSLVLLALAMEDVRHQKVGRGLPVILSGVVVARAITVLPAVGLVWGALLAAPVRPGIRQPRWLVVCGLVVFAAGVAVRDRSLFAVLLWLLIITQWRFNLIGGADAQLQLLLVTLFPTWAMARLLLLIPLVARLLYVLCGRRGRQPMLPVYACAGLLQLWSVV